MTDKSDLEQYVSSAFPKIEIKNKIPGFTDVEFIDLTRDKVKEPLDAHRVEQGRYAIATYSPDRPFLLTYGLASCKGIVFYDKKSRKGLMCHLASVEDLNKVVEGMVSKFGADLSESKVYIVMGNHQNRREHPWPTIEQLAIEIGKHKPARLFIDANKSVRAKGIVLNLETGELKELDGSKGWSWSRQQDTSHNR